MTTLRELRGDNVAARDGVLGSLRDVYFDDQQWAVRYFVVHARDSPRRMLIPPQSVEPGLSGPRNMRLALTRAQAERLAVDNVAAPSRLRSGIDVIGYAIEARDGALGEVQDLVLDDSWAIRDVVVDTRKWWPGGHVNVHPAYVERIDQASRKVHLRLTRAQVRRSGARSARR